VDVVNNNYSVLFGGWRRQVKYKIRAEEIMESDILEGVNAHAIARAVGCDPSYIVLLRQEKRIATEEFYNLLKRATSKK
jgi:hypothetical protein